ncbi:MAG: DNA polymerase III subunit alpha [Deltaproteobacteria bacterium RBG_13_49_15]|nr:MAG: DNA polymerase III subunit alpha [Deltaproteobacteria bacterium RBG_13_49_15]
MVPLVVHSHYSLMQGTASPEELCSAAKNFGYRRLALTDTDNIYGLWPFIKNCADRGITPVIGAEITDSKSGAHAVCLVENHAGYRNLCRIITSRHCDSAFDLKKTLPPFSEGLVVLAQDPDRLSAWHEAGVAVAAAVSGKPTGSGLRLKQIARHFGIPFVAVPGSFFVAPEDFRVHRILRAIEKNTSLSRLDPKETVPPDSWLPPASVFVKRFQIWPEAICASEALAERLAFTGPRFGQVLPPWTDAAGRSAEEFLREETYTGACRRYGEDLPETIVERLEHELNIIREMGFSSYFLVVQEIVSKSPRTCGRGSGAASLVAYCLGITNVCPIRHNLYFERFLNPGRKDPPDIDVDFAWDERDSVQQMVLERYRGHAAMVCNHVAFQPRMAIRETAKVFGLTDREIGQVSKRLPWFWRTEDAEDDLLLRLKNLPELRSLDFPRPWPEILVIAQKIIGIPRYLSVHSGGVVITPDRIDEYVPVEIAPKGVPVIQWEKDGAEESGLVKIDLLGNRSLGVIRDAIVNLKENRVPFDEQCWEPEEDPATQAEVATGDTMGCFYIESPAMRLLQKKCGVGDFEHLVIHSSIIRPAANDFIREYIRRLHGGFWEPIHPLLEDVLDETFGIMVYQEDVSKTAVALAGFSHTDADGLRKIMSKKDKARKLKDYREQFIAGARGRGVADDRIQAVWSMMMSFDGYSFCKPHSASYAKVSFQAAYLKTHFQAEFMAAVISNQGGFYSAFAYVSEARRMGLTVLPPDINQSEIRWRGKDKTLRVGLLSISGVTQNTQKKIIENRKNLPYRNLTDFLNRVKPEVSEARPMIHAGAFDSLHPDENRTSLLWELALWQKLRSAERDLFNQPTKPDKPAFPSETQTTRLRHEYASLGFLCDRHPMTLFADRLRNMGIVKAEDLSRYAGKQVRIAGLLITGKVVHTRHGDPMEFLTFEDETGLVETTFFPETYRRFCSILDKTRPFILSGKVEEDFGAVTLTVNRAAGLH